MTAQTQVTAKTNVQSLFQGLSFEARKLSDVFPEIENMDFAINVALPGHPLVPRQPEGYVMPETVLKMTVLWLVNLNLAQGLLITGETGTGKTEFVLTLAARLNLPVARVECNGFMSPDKFDGGTRLVPTDNGIVTEYQLSDVARVYRDGGIILLDEVDKASDEVCERLHAIIDGKPITITDTGEVIYKHPLCKVIGTSNTVGDGTSVRYVTSRKWDEAFRARWACIEMTYLSAIQELDMLKARFPKLSGAVLAVAVRLANECRDASLGPERDGSVKRPMMSIFSTRVLVNWLKTVMAFKGSMPLRDSLNFSFRNMLTTADKITFDGIYQRVTGQEVLSNMTAAEWFAALKK